MDDEKVYVYYDGSAGATAHTHIAAGQGIAWKKGQVRKIPAAVAARIEGGFLRGYTHDDLGLSAKKIAALDERGLLTLRLFGEGDETVRLWTLPPHHTPTSLKAMLERELQLEREAKATAAAQADSTGGQTDG